MERDAPAGIGGAAAVGTGGPDSEGARGGIALLRFELFVRDAERSIRFYRSVLGFGVHARASGYAELSNGAVRIGVAPIAGLPQDHYFRGNTGARMGVGVEIVFEVDDISEYECRAGRAGAVFEPLQRRPWGRRDFRVVDPDGYYIRVTETLRDGARAGAATRQRANGGPRSP